MKQSRQGYACGCTTKPNATHAALPAHSPHRGSYPAGVRQHSLRALTPSTPIVVNAGAHRQGKPQSKPKFASAHDRPRGPLRAFNEGGGERIPPGRNDATLGDESADEARGGHVEAVI